MFQKVDGKLTTAELRSFRDYLIKNPFVVAELTDIDAFKQKVWISYLVDNASQYSDLIKEYDSSKQKIKEIIADAEREQTQWETVIALFNDRFSVPFKVQVENKGDAVLNVSAPQIAFYVEDRDGQTLRKTDRAILDKGLSNGEKRALYILNIIFEIEARRKAGIETLVVLDDIADSFDYKNKYAIIEYLNDMRNDENFHLIILSHNYDFYRTVRGRLGIYGDNKLLSNRQNGALQLIRDSLSDNPFEDWKKNLTDPIVLVASIPFVRNLAEYVGNETTFTQLTALLHIKEQTKTLTIAELYAMYGSVLAEGTFSDFSDMDGTVFECVMAACEAVCSTDDDDLSLEQKIALSVGIRLVTEEVLIAKINDPDSVEQIGKNQTGKLIRKYEKLVDCDPVLLRAVKRVSLMTPENIHLNSFMFEPILDMSGHHLKTLFEDVKACAEP
jgi:energy-coupling factor transporter ATP-binding protein EcfA2